jgi:hypothetical protein
MFGFGKKRKEDKALEAAFKRISQALTDDDLQLRFLGPQQYSYFKALSAIDKHPNGEGAFGTSLKNPIPANGPIGTISYLSNLTTSSGQRITFHRISAFGNIDVYEFVALSGSPWGFFFVDMYQSRKSTLVPKNFTQASAPQQFIGFNHFWDDFPFGFAEQKQALPKDMRLLYASVNSVSHEMTGRDYVRPELHAAVRDQILAS